MGTTTSPTRTQIGHFCDRAYMTKRMHSVLDYSLSYFRV